MALCAWSRGRWSAHTGEDARGGQAGLWAGGAHWAVAFSRQCHSFSCLVAPDSRDVTSTCSIPGGEKAGFRRLTWHLGPWWGHCSWTEQAWEGIRVSRRFEGRPGCTSSGWAVPQLQSVGAVHRQRPRQDTGSVRPAFQQVGRGAE